MLERGLGDRFTIQQQDAVAIPNWKGANAPEPDLAVIAPGYIDPLPTAATTFAIVEVSDTTYARDRKKVELYVGAGIPSYIVNIEARRVESYESADDLKLESGRVATIDGSFRILGVEIRVMDLLDGP